MERSADISGCGHYHYSLTRVWMPEKPMCTFGMVNPSTADATVDDPTIRKCTGFASRLGFGGFLVWNLFAFRATDVKEIAFAADPIGIRNNAAIIDALEFANTHIAAWGSRHKLKPKQQARIADIITMTKLAGHDLHCLGETKDGDPRHPLMTPYSLPLTMWSRSIK